MLCHLSASASAKLRFFGSLLALATVGSAGAQDFYYRYMTDLDQRRTFLARNGSMFCVPTSYANMLIYMGEAGIPGLTGLGQGYNQQSYLIAELGQLMETDPVDGTEHPTAVAGFVQYLNDNTDLFFAHYVKGPDSDWGVEKIKQYIAGGAITKVGYGKYKKSGSKWTRDGGHAVTLAGYDYVWPEDKHLWVANPWTGDDDSKTTQTDFYISRPAVKNIYFNTTDYGYATHARIGANSSTKINVIDTMHAVLPVWVAWTDVETIVLDQPLTLWAAMDGAQLIDGRKKTVFRARIPDVLGGRKGGFREIDVDLPGTVKDWALDPGG
ncbi:hypothetical protein EON82_17925, partial [bacterium]